MVTNYNTPLHIMMSKFQNYLDQTKHIIVFLSSQYLHVVVEMLVKVFSLCGSREECIQQAVRN